MLQIGTFHTLEAQTNTLAGYNLHLPMSSENLFDRVKT